MHQKHKILELRAKGYSYNQIKLELGCSKGSISYHCNTTTKAKATKRMNNRRKVQHPYQKKLETFVCKKRKPTQQNTNLTNNTRITKKIIHFRTTKGNKTMSNFTIKDVIEKFGENPRCYLTGELINIYEPSTYQFDHIKPASRGGSNELDNLGIATPQANFAKRDMTVEELLDFCKKVLNNFDYDVIKRKSAAEQSKLSAST